MQNLAQYHDENDDGFGGSAAGERLIRGTLLRWNETTGWTDRDGLPPPDMLIVLACAEALQRWQGKRPVETITAKPLPDISALNDAIPTAEWEPGLNGKPKAPWVHQYVAYLIDPVSAGFFTYLNDTVGARIAVENLREKVITMRALRDAKVVPVVKLGHRPMKTNFGMKHRPEFEVVDWRKMGGAIGAPQAAPRIAGPAAPEAKLDAAPANETLASMGEVSTPSFTEILDDEIPF